MNNSYKKKFTKKDIYLLDKYLFKFKLKSTNPTIESIYKTSKYTITIYKKGTLLIQGYGFENILKMIDPKTNSNQKSNNSKIDLKKEIVGSDEVGNGDTFGGMVFCAAYIRKENIPFINELNIRDSKIYTNDQICNLYKKIKDKIEYEVLNLYPNEYNDLYDKCQNQNIVKSYGHNYVLTNLHKNNNLNTKESISIIDQFAPFSSYEKYILSIKSICRNTIIGNEFMETKAESKYIQVAVASIVARYYFIIQMDELSKKSKINIPFGSSTNITNRAINQFKLNKINLREYAKLHFNIFKNIKV